MVSQRNNHKLVGRYRTNRVNYDNRRGIKRHGSLAVFLMALLSALVLPGAFAESSETPVITASLLADRVISVEGNGFPDDTDVKVEYNYAGKLVEHKIKSSSTGSIKDTDTPAASFYGEVVIRASAKVSKLFGLVKEDVSASSTPEPVATSPPSQESNDEVQPTIPKSENVNNSKAPQGIVTAEGNKLMLDGKQYRYVGVNAFGLTGLELGQKYTRAELDTLFTSLPPQTMVRIWAWKDMGIEPLREVVKAAEDNNQFLILSLSEGAGHDSIGRKNTDWYQNGFRKDVLPWVDEVVPAFKNSKAVGMWEVMNEPGLASDEVQNSAMETFMSEVAAAIKKNDPYHLVESGSMDCKNGKGWGNCLKINSDPNIDVLDTHDYADAFEGGRIVSSNYTEPYELLKSLNKPWIVGESGVLATKHSPEERAQIFKQKFDAYFELGVDGINIWNYMVHNTGDEHAFGPDHPIMTMMKSYQIK